MSDSDAEIALDLGSAASPDAEVVLPANVSNDETIVRAIKTPSHLTKRRDRIRPSAFQPVPNTNELSVIRQLMGDNYCKKMALHITKPGEYAGLSSGLVGVVRDAGAEVVDKPEDFPGHAHIETPFFNKGVPLEGDELLASAKYSKAMMGHFEYQCDPEPDRDRWYGRPLGRSA